MIWIFICLPRGSRWNMEQSSNKKAYLILLKLIIFYFVKELLSPIIKSSSDVLKVLFPCVSRKLVQTCPKANSSIPPPFFFLFLLSSFFSPIFLLFFSLFFSSFFLFWIQSLTGSKHFFSKQIKSSQCGLCPIPKLLGHEGL